MQSHTGILRCADCNDKHDFSSAASLLSHFAQHIILAEAVTPTEPSSSLSVSWKKKSDSILEQILHRTAKRNTSSKNAQLPRSGPPMLLPINLPHLKSRNSSPLLNFLKEKTEPARNQDEENGRDAQETPVNQSSSCSSSSSTSSTNSSFNGHLPAANVLLGSSVNLAKFDMQQRLENCVLNLVSKRGVKRSAEMIPDLPPLIPTKKMYSDTSESWDSISTSEEINPLTLCTVTIDDCENGTDSDELKFDSSRKMSGRKQLAPKRISRPENDMIHELSSKLPEHTTLTSVDCSTSPEREKPHAKKKYPCHICSKVFGWSTDLKRHILIHTGERPFKCKLCPSSFTRNFLLQKHESKVHHRNGARCVVNGQLDAIALKLQSAEQKDSLLSILPNLEIPFGISSKPIEDTAEVSEEDPEMEGDDRSSADENDNHNQKHKSVSLELQDPCRVKNPWHPTNLAQEATQ